MTPNKYWFFVEGDCEEQFVLWFFRNHHSTISQERKEYDLVNSLSKDCFHITNCESGDKIPHELKEAAYKINSMHNVKVIIVCDLEKFSCPIAKKEHFIKIINKSINPNILYVFSLPMIEQIYCTEIITTQSIIQKFYKLKYGTSLTSVKMHLLNKTTGSPAHKLRVLHENHNLTYKKVIFSQNFFSQLDYLSSTNPTVNRLAKLI